MRCVVQLLSLATGGAVAGHLVGYLSERDPSAITPVEATALAVLAGTLAALAWAAWRLRGGGPHAPR